MCALWRVCWSRSSSDCRVATIAIAASSSSNTFIVHSPLLCQSPSLASYTLHHLVDGEVCLIVLGCKKRCWQTQPQLVVLLRLYLFTVDHVCFVVVVGEVGRCMSCTALQGSGLHGSGLQGSGLRCGLCKAVRRRVIADNGGASAAAETSC